MGKACRSYGMKLIKTLGQALIAVRITILGVRFDLVARWRSTACVPITKCRHARVISPCVAVRGSYEGLQTAATATASLFDDIISDSVAQSAALVLNDDIGLRHHSACRLRAINL